jgi:hypothetical protein
MIVLSRENTCSSVCADCQSKITTESVSWDPEYADCFATMIQRTPTRQPGLDETWAIPYAAYKGSWDISKQAKSEI